MELNVIRQADPQVADAIEAELNRQRSHIELIASENFVSPAVMAAMGSCLTNKYAEGYPLDYHIKCNTAPKKERHCVRFVLE